MFKLWLPKACEMGFYAVMALACGAEASDWCPTQSDWAITCSNCSRKLTCSFSGTIGITGNSVNLDGNNQWIYNSKYESLWVTGDAAVIRNLNINNSGGNGITFRNDVTGTVKSSTLVNVFVWASRYDGMFNIGTGDFSQYVNGSTFMGNREGMNVSHTWSAPFSQTNVYNSSMESNRYSGYYGGQGNGQQHAYNYYYANASRGLETTAQSGGYYAANHVERNVLGGIYVSNWASQQGIGIYSNIFYANGVSDCDGSQAAHLDVSGNSWTVNNGCITK